MSSLPEYTIYGNNTCVYCDRAKDLLTRMAVDFDYRNVDNDFFLNQLKVRLREMDPNRTRLTIPQIWRGDIYIGGFEDLKNTQQAAIQGYADGSRHI